jgi:hypothetical protein
MGIKIFLGAVEITELERRKFPLQDIHHLRNPHPLSSSHGLEIEVWIDIEVSHLDEIEACLSDQFYQSLHFVFPVCESWEDKKIDRSVDSFLFRLDQGIYNFPK